MKHKPNHLTITLTLKPNPKANPFLTLKQNIGGCAFHFQQALWRRIVNLFLIMKNISAAVLKTLVCICKSF